MQAPAPGTATCRGFSLIELMITITIAAIMLALAAPGMSQLLANSRIATQSSDMMANLALARSEAIKRGVRTTLCPSDSGTGCTATAWSAGYMAFVDSNGDGSFNTGSDIVLRVSGRSPGNSTLASSDFSAAVPLQFLPSGQASKAGSFSVCQSGQPGRIIAVTLAGGASAVVSSVCS
jgi:type IV fimbrial biogenesis protein FimT